jgi:hypothetical protein
MLICCRSRTTTAAFVAALALIATLLDATVGTRVAYANHTTMRRVSVDSSGAQAASSSQWPSISGDGRYMAFESAAWNLVPGDTNGAFDVFVRDLSSASVTRVSVSSTGAQANGWSVQASISADGRYVVFQSGASDLVSGDTNGWNDIFLHDRVAGTTTRVSLDSAGSQANNASYLLWQAVSSDGRYVAFASDGTNLVASDTNGKRDIFRRDLLTGTTARVSVNSQGAQADNASYGGAISSDGRYVAFLSHASNLVLGDTNFSADIFIRDMVMGTTSLVSVDSNEVQSIGAAAGVPLISPDARYVVWESGSANLVLGDTNNVEDIFVRDRVAGTTTRVSVADSTGTQSNNPSRNPSISSDGRYVVFMSLASNLVSGDTNDRADIFVRDWQTGRTIRASTDAGGVQANAASDHPSISGDGRLLAFDSSASNLVPADTNALSDIFVRDFGELAPPAPSFSTQPAPFSPNNDGVKEATTFEAQISDASPPISWTLSVKQGSTTVKSWSGTGSASPVSISQPWDGRNSAGAIVADGDYTVTLTAIDDWANLGAAGSASVTVDTGPPNMTLVAPHEAGNTVYPAQPIVARVSDIFAITAESFAPGKLPGPGSGVDPTSAQVIVADPSGQEGDRRPVPEVNGGVVRAQPTSLTRGREYSVTVIVADLAGNRSTRSGTFVVLNSATLTPASQIPVSIASMAPSQIQPSGTTDPNDLYIWNSVDASVASFTVFIDASLHPGRGTVQVAIPTGQANVMWSTAVGGVPGIPVHPRETTASAAVEFATDAKGQLTLSVASQTVRIPQLTALVPKGADSSSVRLSLASTVNSATFPLCSDPTTIQSPCSPDPLPRYDCPSCTPVEFLVGENGQLQRLNTILTSVGRVVNGFHWEYLENLEYHLEDADGVTYHVGSLRVGATIALDSRSSDFAMGLQVTDGPPLHMAFHWNCVRERPTFNTSCSDGWQSDFQPTDEPDFEPEEPGDWAYAGAIQDVNFHGGAGTYWYDFLWAWVPQTYPTIAWAWPGGGAGNHFSSAKFECPTDDQPCYFP